MEEISLINELTQGKELAKQLCTHLLSSSYEENEFLIEQILSTYEKALSMLNQGENKIITGQMVDFHSSFSEGSPRSEVMDQDFKHKDSFKKRKCMPRWTKQVKVCPGTGLEYGCLDDGYNWRKYGQKDILGAKFPRGYYRCTHRNVQGCLATKQVQRSDEDPTILEITYRGRHTCRKASHMSKTVSLKRKIGLGENQLQKRHQIEPLEEPNPEEFFSFGAELQVKTEDLDIFPSFSLTSPSENEDNLFFTQNPFMESFSSTQTSVCNSPIDELNLFDFDSEFQEFFSS